MAEGRQYFSQLEKSLLTELVRKHKDLVEKKRNYYKTIQQITGVIRYWRHGYNRYHQVIYHGCHRVQTVHIYATIVKYSRIMYATGHRATMFRISKFGPQTA